MEKGQIILKLQSYDILLLHNALKEIMEELKRKKISYKVTKENITLYSVSSEMIDKVGYISINVFGENDRRCGVLCINCVCIDFFGGIIDHDWGDYLYFGV